MEPERCSPAPAQPGPRTLLNILLRDGVQHLLDNAPHADFFRAGVSCVVVNDYHNYVLPEQEMFLGRMLERAESHHYLSVASFRADLQLVYQNAAAYNGRKGGKHAYEPVIHWASDIVAAAEEQLQLRMPALLAAEAELQQLQHQADAVTGGEDTAAANPTAASSPAEVPPLEVQVPMTAAACEQELHPLGPHPDVGGAASPCAAVDGCNISAGQQSSSPSSGSGDGSHSGLEALLAACELAAEQESATPRAGSVDGAPGCNGSTPAPAAVTAPERRSYPGFSSPAKTEQPPHVACQAIVLVPNVIGPGQVPRQQLTALPEEPAGSSEDGGVALCCGRSGATDAGASTAQLAIGGAGGGSAAACTSYLTSNAFKNRRHKSKVFIKPNKVVYLPTTFVEEEFNVTALPLDCELKVEADGVLMDDAFKVTIKAVPRQGLSTMYCMTNVMRFQQQYLNWQIYNWTRMDNSNIKIHLQSPSPSQSQLQRPDLDRCASMPEVGRNFGTRNSDDGGGAAPRASAGSLKRKSDTGRYNMTKVERRIVAEPSRDLPMELRLSSNGYVHRPSPIPESPPASPQRRVSSCLAPLPPRGPTAGQQLPLRHPLHPPYQHPHQLYHSFQPLAGMPYQVPPMRPSHHAAAVKQEQQQSGSEGGDAMDAMQFAMQQPHMPSGQQPRLSANGGGRGAQLPHPARSLEQQLHDLSQQLQLGGQGDAPSLAALQFALASALQQQQHLGHGMDVPSLDLAAALEQERLLQQRAGRGANGLDLHHVPVRRDSGELGAAGEYGAYDMGAGGFGRRQVLHAGSRGPAPEPYAHREPLQQQRRPSHGRQGGAASRPPRQHHASRERRNDAQQALDDEDDAAAASEEQYAMRFARGSGHGGNPFPGPVLGRLAFDIGSGGPVGAPGSRRGNSSSGTGMEGGLPHFPAGFDLSACSTAELMSLLSPTKRYKVAGGASQLQAADGGGGPPVVGGAELAFLEAMDWRGGQLPPMAEAALASLRGGPFPQSALSGRPFMQMGPELLGQLM